MYRAANRLKGLLRSTNLKRSWLKYRTGFFIGFAGGFSTLLYFKMQRKNTMWAKVIEVFSAGEFLEGLPIYTMEDIRGHNSVETRIWVAFRSGVYDITDFIEEHPGGKDKIKLASGKSLESFWNLYRQHNTEDVHETLEKYRIGNLDENDRTSNLKNEDSNDPYASDPERHPALIIRSDKPFNAETPPQLLTDSLVTPNEIFFVRNHLPVPHIDPETYVLEIRVDGSDKTYKLTLEDLKRLTPTSITATIQCAGNRRNDLTKVKPVRGLDWDTGAIGTALWTGPKLKDVLSHVGLELDQYRNARHVHFEALDCDSEHCYAASIPIEKLLSPSGDVLLAYEMNGSSISRDHGFPIRVIVPGTVGARNVKWLSKIILSPHESSGHWQQRDYKGFSPNTNWDNVDYSNSPSIQELPVQSAIIYPQKDTHIDEEDSEVTIKGYAWSGGGRGIVRVDVSVDGGKTWSNAELSQMDQEYNKKWAWTLWKAEIPIPKDHSGELNIRCKAVDESYNVQPDSSEPIWNLRGVLSNAWHKMDIPIRKSEE